MLSLGASSLCRFCGPILGVMLSVLLPFDLRVGKKVALGGRRPRNLVAVSRFFFFLLILNSLLNPFLFCSSEKWVCS